jgi:hypothetical protein
VNAVVFLALLRSWRDVSKARMPFGMNSASRFKSVINSQLAGTILLRDGQSEHDVVCDSKTCA